MPREATRAGSWTTTHVARPYTHIYLFLAVVQKSLPLVIKPFLRISKRKKRLSRVITAPAHTAASSASRSHQGLRVKIRLLRVNCADIVYFKHWLLKE